MMEYDPQPPSDCGTAGTAAPELTAIARAAVPEAMAETTHTVTNAATRFAPA